FTANKIPKSQKLEVPMKYHILHYAYPGLQKYFAKTLGKYGELEAKLRHERGERFSLLRFLFHPPLTFFRRFILKGGFRDGIRGFLICILYSQYRFSIQANLWQISQEEQSLHE
ncbi:MAG: hypothetical protein AAF696_35855, partial [Bacteroidota bacterium]